MKLSDFLVQELFTLTGTEKFFGYIGGMVAHIVDSVYLNKNTELVNTINEQGAGFAAEGYARTTGKTGVVIATSGPGATNLITTIADCFFDSVPVIFITGQVNTYEYMKYNIRQNGFQETNITDTVKPLIKYSKRIENKNEIKYELQKAVHIANSGRKGPCLIDIPMDIQREDVELNLLKPYKISKKPAHKPKIDFNIFEKSKKPLVLVGNGVKISGCSEKLKEVLTKYEIPVVQSLHGIDCVENSYKYNMGFIGTYGNRYGNFALYNSDLLIVLGSRLDIRQTGNNSDFMKNKTIVHVDIDENELNCSKFNKIKINSDVSDFLDEFKKANLSFKIEKWKSSCLKLKEKFSNNNKEYKLPNIILEKIFDQLKENTVITTDVGQNQMWAAQSAKIKYSQQMITSGGHGAMGFSIPAAIGASIAGKNVVAICGDGGAQMNIQELEVIKRRNLPVKIIILNNRSLGMVKSFQEIYFDNRFASTVYDYTSPDFASLANAYKINSIKVEAEKFNTEEIKKPLLSDEPFLIEIVFKNDTQVEPRLKFGNSLENLSPYIDLDEVKKIIND